MADTKIEWAGRPGRRGRVWNPVTGCTPTSPGCAHCYAQRMSKRLAGRCGYPADDPFRVTLHHDKLEEPLRWRTSSDVFVDSMGDLFHADVPFGFIAKVFGVMHTARQHTYMILTKRPGRMAEFIEWYRKTWLGSFAAAWPKEYPHVWLGVSAENQQTADERIPLLLHTPAVIRFVSCEPLLGPVDLREYIGLTETNGGWKHFEQHGWGYDEWSGGFLGTKDSCYDAQPGVHWAITGGETGPGARPMHPDWARRLRAQCQAADVPFFFKSWGDWKPIGQMEHGECDALYHPAPERDPDATRRCKVETTVLQLDGSERREWPPGAMQMFRVGKKAAGRLLDGHEYSEFPVLTK